MLQIGSLVDNKYKILSEVGHGGMSVVYLAINERANKTWAVKEVRKDGVCDFEAVKQGLVVETDMLKRLNHPNLPSIIDVIDTEDSFLIVMDYIEGKSLQSVLKSGGAQPQDRVIEWGKQLCDVLGYLHTREPAIIYRDMKPANVMLKPDGNITLIDFGTAREFKNRAMVEDTTCLGTRGYAAPEQFGGRGQTDARTDIYCVGATLYHLLTGHSPAEPPYEIKPLSYWDPMYAGTGIEKVILKCCQQDPEARYQSCAELMYALDHVQDEDDAARKIRKHKWFGFLACLIICLLGVVGMVVTTVAKGNAEKQTYDTYIKLAEQNLNDLETAMDHYHAAIKVDPGNPEAYEGVLELILRDQQMSDAENGWLTQCLNDNDGGNMNQSYLQTDEPVEYDKLMYKIGLLYFFHYDRENSRSLACPYFEKVLDSQYLSSEQRELANSLFAIGKGYEQLNVQSYLEESYSYADFWTDLQTIMEGDLQSKVGDRKYCIAICKQVAYLINANCDGFKGKNISEAEMLELLDKAEAQLNEMTFSEAESDWATTRDSALQNIENARLALNALFHGAGVED